MVCFAINMLKHVDCVDGAGTSSFGMSGVNAHAIFTAAPIVERMQAASSVRYQRQRCWAVAAPHHLLGPAQPGRERCSFALDLLKPELSYLGDHQVSTCGRTTLCKMLCPSEHHKNGRTVVWTHESSNQPLLAGMMS